MSILSYHIWPSNSNYIRWRVQVMKEILQYAIFWNLLELHPSCVQIVSSVSSSRTPSVYSLSLTSQIKFHTHTKPYYSYGLLLVGNYDTLRSWNWAIAAPPSLGRSTVELQCIQCNNIKEIINSVKPYQSTASAWEQVPIIKTILQAYNRDVVLLITATCDR
jgi:hypothetical protein